MIREHASCVAIDGQGVLLLGPSGAGKSDLALRLIDGGGQLVADDYTELTAENGVLQAAPPAMIAGKIEVRGVGIVTMPFLPRCPVALAVHLDAPHKIVRLPEPDYLVYETVKVPLLALSALEASTPAKIRLAVRQGPEWIWRANA